MMLAPSPRCGSTARHLDVAADVGLQGLLQVRVFQVFQPLAVQLERGVVDQDVDAAERLGHLLDRLVAEARIAHVTGDHHAAAAFALHVLAGDVRVLGLVQVQHRHIGAFACEQHRHRTADAGIATGDDRAHALQLAAAGVVRCKETRRQLQFVFMPGLGQLLRRHRLRLPACAGLGRGLLRGLLCRARVLGLFLVLQAPLPGRNARARGSLAAALRVAVFTTRGRSGRRGLGRGAAFAHLGRGFAAGGAFLVVAMQVSSGGRLPASGRHYRGGIRRSCSVSTQAVGGSERTVSTMCTAFIPPPRAPSHPARNHTRNASMKHAIATAAVCLPSPPAAARRWPRCSRSTA
jgi:hypothetical protein